LSFIARVSLLNAKARRDRHRGKRAAFRKDMVQRTIAESRLGDVGGVF